jgi:hypothetical protein
VLVRALSVSCDGRNQLVTNTNADELAAVASLWCALEPYGLGSRRTWPRRLARHSPAAAHARQPKKVKEPLTGRARYLSDVACGLTAIRGCARRSRIPARCEGVLEANSAFSLLIREGSRLRRPRIARTRSLPALGPARAGRRLKAFRLRQAYGATGSSFAKRLD